jgi:hypothetical protein
MVCIFPAVPTPGLSFVKSAFAHTYATSGGAPFVTNESGEPTARVSYPEPGKVCMSGDDGAQLELHFGSGEGWDGENLPNPARAGYDGSGLFHAKDLGITAVSFTIESPPSAGVSPWILAWLPPCGDFFGGNAEKDGSRLAISTSGTTTTLSFATDFSEPFDTNAIDGLNFDVGPGAYDYCITNLKFLDANGMEVTP